MNLVLMILIKESKRRYNGVAEENAHSLILSRTISIDL